MKNEVTAHGKPYLEKNLPPFGRFLKVALTPQKHTTINFFKTTPKVPQKLSQNYLKNIGICHPLYLLNVQNYLKTNIKTTSKLSEYVHPPPSPHILFKRKPPKKLPQNF